MAEEKYAGGLEINQDLEHFNHELLAERMGWAIFALILAAALSGLLGAGPLSASVAGDRGSFWVAYNRFERSNATTRLEFHVNGRQSPDGRLLLSVNREYLKKMELDLIDPAPELVESQGDTQTFYFRWRPAAAPGTIVIRARGTAGIASARFRLANGPELRFRQIIYP